MADLTFGWPQSYTFSDKRGFKAVTRMFLDPTGTTSDAFSNAELVAVALAGVSRSARVLHLDGTTQVIKSNGIYSTQDQPFIAATSGAYDSIADKLVIVFRDSSGANHRYQIPCPLETIFATDHVQALSADAHVALLASQILAADTNGGTATTTLPVVSRQGDPVVAFGTAYRRRSQTPRRLNLELRQPDGNSSIWP